LEDIIASKRSPDRPKEPKALRELEGLRATGDEP
jgi:hypothetical protein